MGKIGKNVIHHYIWKYQDYDANFWSYTPIFNPTELEYNTSRHLKWLGSPKLGPKAIKLVKMAKIGKNAIHQYIWKYQDHDANLWSYTPIFNPAELEYNTFRHLKWLGIPKLGPKAIKLVKNGQNW